MTDQQERALIGRSIDQALAGLKPDPGLAQRIVHQEKEEPRVKKKMSVGLAVVLALALFATVAFAVSAGFGILDYLPQQAENQPYVEAILQLDQEWEGQYFSAVIRQAAFDGMKMTFTMSITPREGADPVYVIPSIRATANGQPLNVWVMGGRSGFTDEGFWVPNIIPFYDYDYANWAVEVALSNDGWTYTPFDQEIEWEVDLEVLHTDWPIRFTQEDELGEEPLWTDAEWEAYDAQFAQAYANREVLLNQAGMFSSWLHSTLPRGIEEVVEQPFADYLKAALTQEAFTLAERAVFRFDTPAQQVKTAKHPIHFATPDGFEVELTELNVSTAQIGMTLRITRFPQDTSQTLFEEWPWELVLLAEGAKTDLPASSLSQMEDGSLEYALHTMVEGATQKLILVPIANDYSLVTVDSPDGPMEIGLGRALMQQMLPLTAEQEQLAVEIELN